MRAPKYDGAAVSRALATLLALAACRPACAGGDALGTLPPERDAGADAYAGVDAAADASLDAEGGVDAGGPPCSTALDCDDGLACTRDECDPVSRRCARTPDHALCSNGVTCDGVERCDLEVGCRAGPPVTCDDGDPCSLDACDEATQACLHAPRDADGDGDPDAHCVPESARPADCDDSDPLVSSKRAEVCGNGRDDDCDGEIDEADCAAPAHEDCLDPLIIAGEGSFPVSLVGAKLDLGASCVPTGASVRDAVLAITIPDGPPRRVDVRAIVPDGTAEVAIFGVCGQPSSELSCSKSGATGKGAQVAHARAWSVSPGVLPVAIYGDADTTAVVDVRFSDAGAPPTNETCGAAAPLTPGVEHVAPLIGAAADLPTACAGSGGELVYRLELDAPHDVRVFASTVDGLGSAQLSLRTEPCGVAAGELACFTGNPVSAFARGVGPGPVWVSVRATAPTDVSLLATLEPPTKPPADERCDTAPPLPPSGELLVQLADHTDDHTACGPGLVDAAYALELTETSDVLGVLRVSQTDYGALSFARAPCATKDDLLACTYAASSPMRVASYGVPKGSYRYVVELADGAPATLLSAVRPAVAPTFVPLADTCDAPMLIPPTGGRFLGNTSNAFAQYSAGCDQGGTGPFGAPEQMFRLELPEKRRVLFDTSGSSFATILDVRKGPSCPGTELQNGCAAGYLSQRSFVDLTLSAGTYFVQLDGFALQSGAYELSVWVLPP
ncbi:MAG: putative metal-binding motif-containing protein [Polyangiaceae bacterium]|nr:putative metal-binding motif-containing protein [Polyangiaceae bacterium]